MDNNQVPKYVTQARASFLLRLGAGWLRYWWIRRRHGIKPNQGAERLGDFVAIHRIHVAHSLTPAVRKGLGAFSFWIVINGIIVNHLTGNALTSEEAGYRDAPYSGKANIARTLVLFPEQKQCEEVRAR